MADQAETGTLQIAPKYLLILVLPVVVVTASEFLLGNFGDTGIGMPDGAMDGAAPYAELSARYRFLAAYFFFVAVCVTLVAIFCFELRARHTRRSILTVFCGLIPVIAISLVFSTFEPAWMGSFEAYQLLGADLFQQGLARGKMPSCAPGALFSASCDGQGAFFGMTYLLDKVNILSSLATAAIIAGMVLALARPHAPDLASHKGLVAEGRILQASVEATRRYLYLSGVLLTTGIALGLAWMHWPAGQISAGSVRANYGELVDAISLFRGVSYSVMILSYYMPVSLILMVRIDRFRDAAILADSPELAADISGFQIENIGSLDAFKAILAIVSPIIASAVGSFGSLSMFG